MEMAWYALVYMCVRYGWGSSGGARKMMAMRWRRWGQWECYLCLRLSLSLGVGWVDFMGLRKGYRDVGLGDMWFGICR